MKKTLLTAGLFCLSFISNAQCDAVTTLNETFEDFTGTTLPENCWTASTGSPKVTIATVQNTKAIQLYSFMTPAVPFYVVSPELAAIDGDKELSFTLKPVSGTMTVEVGTLLSATDYTSFQAIGTPIQVSSTATTFSNIVVPASTTQKHIAFKVVAVAQHQAAVLDNIVYQSNLGIGGSEISTFKVFPNPSIDRNVTVSYDTNATGNISNSIAIYNITGAAVFETKLQHNSGTNTINLSSLASGVYILKLQSGDYSATKKLVLK